MIGGEKIALQLETDQGESEVQIPAVLAALLEQNEHARNQFYKLSAAHKIRLIRNIRGTSEMDKQIGMSLKLLSGTES
ncbi:MAG: hypothetical protein HEP71_24955 [Roseivirga sp.]|nr:hypothetical protein [Roseivirga sp.]